jgi:hypothetical protein
MFPAHMVKDDANDLSRHGGDDVVGRGGQRRQRGRHIAVALELVFSA